MLGPSRTSWAHAGAHSEPKEAPVLARAAGKGLVAPDRRAV